MNIVDAIFLFLSVWTAIGGVVALIFLTFGIDRIDEDARGAYVFRILMVPAILLIWPLVLYRWYILETGKDNWEKRHKPPRNAHFWVAIIFALAIPSIILLGLSQRQIWPVDFVPQKLSMLVESVQ